MARSPKGSRNIRTRRKADPAPAAPAGSPSPPPLVRAEWLARIEAEYRSCAIAHHLTLWLIQIGASPDLISAGLAIAGDELRHAQLSHAVFRAAGGTDLLPLDRELLQLPRRPGEPLEHDVLRACVEIFCLGETVAVPLFRDLRQGASVPVARRALDQILLDEVRHRDFGWALLGWLLQTPIGPSLQQVALSELPAMFARLHHSYARPGDEADTEIGPAERAWGLMPMARYGAVLRRTVTRDYLPRFARLGLVAGPALGHPAP